MSIKDSELILNPDGSIYHLNLKPENIAHNIILVGDQDRVEKITKHFDNIEFSTQKREFKTQTGFYKGKRLTVVSTGIGPGNIDIVLNELDALVNIDLKTRQPKDTHTILNFVRIGTSGSLQIDVAVDSFVMSCHALDLNGMLHFYKIDEIVNPDIENAFIQHTNWSPIKARPIVINCNKALKEKLDSNEIYKGFTATSGGFYGPQGRILRLPLQNPELNNKMESFNYEGTKITNLEMETSVIYGLSQLLGHQAISLNAIVANRATGQFSNNPEALVERLINYTLEKLV